MVNRILVLIGRALQAFPTTCELLAQVADGDGGDEFASATVGLLFAGCEPVILRGDVKIWRALLAAAPCYI